MATHKTVQGECSLCGAIFAVPAESIGMACKCPHCGRQTEILLAVPVLQSGASRRIMVWAIIGIAILIASLLAAIFAVHLAGRLKQERQRQSSQVFENYSVRV